MRFEKCFALRLRLSIYENMPIEKGNVKKHAYNIYMIFQLCQKSIPTPYRTLPMQYTEILFRNKDLNMFLKMFHLCKTRVNSLEKLKLTILKHLLVTLLKYIFCAVIFVYQCNNHLIIQIWHRNRILKYTVQTFSNRFRPNVCEYLGFLIYMMHYILCYT